jgi:folate-binding protein YgfZ
MGEPDLNSLQGAVRLHDWGAIRAEGADAATFLHGQLTQDVLQLGEHDARLAGYCTAKGRLLASGVLWRGGSGELLLVCSADILAQTIKRLSMFVLRAKCRLSDTCASMALFGLAGRAATAWLGATAPAVAYRSVALSGGGQAVRLPDAAGVARYLVVAPAENAPPALPALAQGGWEWLEVTSGVPRIVAPTVEQFVPQMVNFEFVGGVNFQKGCYPGQEIVARSQYRGTIKRRAFVFACDVPAQPGQDVFHSADSEQPAGMVVNAASCAGSCRALVEVKLAALGVGSLYLANAGGPQLHLVEQPYSIPLEASA